jgi:hypothetical protein
LSAATIVVTRRAISGLGACATRSRSRGSIPAFNERYRASGSRPPDFNAARVASFSVALSPMTPTRARSKRRSCAVASWFFRYDAQTCHANATVSAMTTPMVPAARGCQ